MEVFKIEQKSVPDANQEAKVAQVEATSAPVPDTKPAAQSEPEKKDELLVAVDGPVGRIYTNALNKLLAMEGYTTMIPKQWRVGGRSTETREDLEIHDVEDPSMAVKVWCWDTDSLNMDDVIKISNEIYRHPNRDYVIALEKSDRVTPEVAMLDEVCRVTGKSLVFGLNKAAEKTIGLMKAKKS